MYISELQISDACKQILSNAGMETVDEIINAFSFMRYNGFIRARWISECGLQIIEELIKQGLWTLDDSDNDAANDKPIVQT